MLFLFEEFISKEKNNYNFLNFFSLVLYTHAHFILPVCQNSQAFSIVFIEQTSDVTFALRWTRTKRFYQTLYKIPSTVFDCVTLKTRKSSLIYFRKNFGGAKSRSRQAQTKTTDNINHKSINKCHALNEKHNINMVDKRIWIFLVHHKVECRCT